MSCSTSSTACRSLSARISATMRADSSAPMPASGSSSSSTRGAVASVIAISSWRCSPCDSAAARTSPRSPRPGGGERARGRRVDLVVALGAAEEAHRARQPRLRREAAVLERAEAEEDVGLLVAAPDAALRNPLRRQPGDVLAEQLDAAGARREVAREHVDQRGLARAVGPDHRVHRAAAALERHARHGRQAAEGAAQALGAQRRLSHGPLRRRAGARRCCPGRRAGTAPPRR